MALLLAGSVLHAESIATYRGYRASGGARGVGDATTQAVVWSSVAILMVDYLLTFISIG